MWSDWSTIEALVSNVVKILDRNDAQASISRKIAFEYVVYCRFFMYIPQNRIIDIVRRFLLGKNLEMQKKDKKSSIEADIAVPTNSNFLL